TTPMASKQELQIQQKRELETKEESTIPARAFLPTADIFETEDALHVVLEMPGVEKDNIDVSVREVFVERRRFQLDDCRHAEPPGLALAVTSPKHYAPVDAAPQ